MIRSLLVFCFLGLGSIASAHVAQPAIIQPVAALGWLNELIRWPLTLLLNTPEDPAEAFAAELPVPDFSPEPPCLLEPLTEITDPVALEFETVRGTSDVVRTDGLTQSASVALVRFESLVSRFGGTMTLTSAYRPPAYQQHLQDVWDKWMLELKASIEPACQQLRDEVYQEFASHGLLESQRPASISDHSRGTGALAARV